MMHMQSRLYEYYNILSPFLRAVFHHKCVKIIKSYSTRFPLSDWKTLRPHDGHKTNILFSPVRFRTTYTRLNRELVPSEQRHAHLC